MNDVGVIDTFFDTFNRYIDSGFGLLGGEVAFLANTLLLIDVTLAALFWSMASGEDVLARLIRKVLYVGFFAFIIGNFHSLSIIVLKSFAGLGLKASGSGMSADDLLRPGKLALVGLSSAKPLLEAAGELSGFPAFFENMVQVVVLILAFILVVVAFFVMAVQVFVVLIEFKLTTLAGFVLVPFGLFGRTAFLAEKVLGNVVAAGVKVLVLAVIVGIGASLFDQFTATWAGQPTLEQVLALVLASLTLLGLSIFGPGIAAGLVSGAPQLGAGAAVGTGLAVAGMAVAGAAAAQMAVGGGASLAGAAASAGGGRLPPGGGEGGGAPTGPSSPRPSPGPAPAAAGTSSATSGPKTGPSGGEGGGGGGSGEAASAESAPRWAKDLKQRQDLAHGAGMAAHALGSGDGHGAVASPSLSES